jgi:transcriptional regulator with XRE-family HTH domain
MVSFVVSEGWAVIGEHVRSERKKRRQTQADFARALGISVSLLGAIESGRRDNYEPGTRAVIEWAIGWGPGSLDRVLSGGRPTRAVDPMLNRLLSAWPKLSSDAQAMLAYLAERTVGQD